MRKPVSEAVVNSVLACQSDHLVRVVQNLQRTLRANGLEGDIKITVELDERPKGTRRRRANHRHLTEASF